MLKRLPFCLLALLFGSNSLVAQEDGHWQKMFDVNQRFAEAGSKEGEFQLAEMYEEGRGTAVDLEKARTWYEKAAKQGHEEAQRRVSDWDARQAARARQVLQADLNKKRDEEERARQESLAAQKRMEEERRVKIEAQKRADEERAHQTAMKRAEEEKARQAALKRAEEEKARQAAQKRLEEEKAKQTVAAKPRQEEPVSVAAPVAKSPDASTAAPQAGADSFESDPCKTSAARFMSTCRK